MRRTERGMMKGVKDGWEHENLTARTVNAGRAANSSRLLESAPISTQGKGEQALKLKRASLNRRKELIQHVWIQSWNSQLEDAAGTETSVSAGG